MRINRTSQVAASRRAPPPAGAGSHPAVSVVALMHQRQDIDDRATLTSAPRPPRGLWDPASGRFDTVHLRAAIVSRGWTVAEFAATAGVSRACLYNALRTWATSDRTAIRIATALATREPLSVLITE